MTALEHQRPETGGRSRTQLVVAAMMLVLVVLNAAYGADDSGSAAWFVPVCVFASVLFGWIFDRGLSRFVSALPAPDDDYAVRTVAALPIAVVGAPLIVATSATPLVAAVLSLGFYWLLVEPLISSGTAPAVRARQSKLGVVAGRISRSPRVQHAFRAIAAGLVGIGGVNFLLVEMGVGGDPWVAVGIAVVVIGFDLLAGPESRAGTD